MLVLMLCVWGCVGCAGGFYEADMRAEVAEPATLMVAKKVERPLVVVLDPATVKDTIPIQGELQGRASLLGGDGQLRVLGFHAFLEASLGRILRTQFTSVTFVRPGYRAPAGPHLVAQVRVDGIRTERRAIGRFNFFLLRMSWALAIRPSESEEFLYSFAGDGMSSETYQDLREGIKQMMSSALQGFQSSFADKNVFQELRKLDALDGEGKSRDKLQRL